MTPCTEMYWRWITTGNETVYSQYVKTDAYNLTSECVFGADDSCVFLAPVKPRLSLLLRTHSQVPPLSFVRLGCWCT